MNFHRTVPEELREILSADLKRYEKTVSMSSAERKELYNWIRSGHSPYDNGWYISTESGAPMDFISALRTIEESGEFDVIFDTMADDIVFVPKKYLSENSATAELPF